MRAKSITTSGIGLYSLTQSTQYHTKIQQNTNQLINPKYVLSTSLPRHLLRTKQNPNKIQRPPAQHTKTPVPNAHSHPSDAHFVNP